MLNLFSLHGKYYENNENRLTANFLFLLSELRSSFLPAFLAEIGIRGVDPAKVDVVLQPSVVVEGDRNIPDAIIQCGNEFLVVIEAKIGVNPLDADQLWRYGKYLSASDAKVKRLVAITLVEERRRFDRAIDGLPGRLLEPGSCRYVRWFQVMKLLRSTVALTQEAERSLERAIQRGRFVSHDQRISSMFLQETEATMFEKIVVDELVVGALQDVRLTTQWPWFMDVALRHRVWFPDGKLQHGFAPTRWVAYYQTAENRDNESQITHIARNLIFWNAITFDDALDIPELNPLFRDKAVRAEIQSWPKNQQGTLHMVLTDVPVRLAHPIRLDGSRRAKFVTKKIVSIEDLLAAANVDALFHAAKA